MKVKKTRQNGRRLSEYQNSRSRKPADKTNQLKICATIQEKRCRDLVPEARAVGREAGTRGLQCGITGKTPEPRMHR